MSYEHANWLWGALWFAVLAAILIGWFQYLHFKVKLAVVEHRLFLHRLDLDIARKYIRQHPQDMAAYVDEVQKAIDALPKG